MKYGLSNFSTDIDHSQPQFNAFSGLSVFLAAKGWSDLRPEIYAADSADYSQEQRLKNALQSYMLQPDAYYGEQLLEILDEVNITLKNEYNYAKKQQDLYQKRAQQETGSSLASYSLQWVWDSMQNFFGSSNQALAEKYANIAADCQIKQKDLAKFTTALHQKLQAEHTLTITEEPDEEMIVIDTAQVNSIMSYPTDQTINIGQYYSQSLNGIFSEGMILDATETGQWGLPNWLSIQYQQINDLPTFLGGEGVLAVSGNILVAAGDVLATSNISMPSAPVVLGYYHTENMRDGYFECLAVEGNIIYVTNSYSDVVIFDMTEPTNITLLSRYNGTQGIFSLAVSENHLFVQAEPAYQQGELIILDVSTPTAPQLISNYSIADYVYDMAIADDILALSSDSSILLLNISDSSAPAPLGQYDVASTAQVTSMAISNDTNTLYVGTYYDGLYVLNITLPANPQLLTILQQSGAPINLGNLLLVKAYNTKLFVFDSSKPNNPRLLGSSDTSGFAITAVDDHFIYALDGLGELSIIDLCQGQLTGVPQGYAGQLIPITVSGRTIMEPLNSTAFRLTLDTFPYPIESSLQTMSIFPNKSLFLPLNTNSLFVVPSNSFVGFSLQLASLAPLPSWAALTAALVYNNYFEIDSSPPFHSLVAENNILFAKSNTQVLIFDVTTSTPQLLSTYNASTITYAATPYDIAVSDDILFVAVSSYDNYALQIINVSIPSDPQLLSNYSTVNLIESVAIWNNLAILTDYTGIEILDVSTPAMPKTLSTMSGIDSTSYAMISSSIAYVLTYNYGLVLIDVNNPSNPELIFNYTSSGGSICCAMTVTNNIAIIGISSSVGLGLGIDIIDVSVKTAPRSLSQYFFHDVDLFTLLLSGNTLLATCEENGLVLLDISTPTAPQLLGSYSGSIVDSAAVASNTIFLTNSLSTYAGLLTLSISYWQLTAVFNAKSAGNYPMILTATDSLGGSASDDFIIRLEAPPQFNYRIPLQYAPVGQTYNFLISQGLCTDPNLDPISFSASLSDGSQLPQWLQFGDSSGLFLGVPQLSSLGTLNLTLFATDNIAGTTNTSFLLFVGNPIPNPPVLRENRLFSFQVPLDTFAVGDGRSRNYSAVQANGEPLPGWMDFYSLDFEGVTPSLINNTALNLQINVIAMDDQGDKIIAPVNFVVMSNSPLQANPISVQIATVGDQYIFFPPSNTFINPNNYPLTYSASQTDGSPLPKWLTFDDTDEPTFSGTPGYGDTDTYAPRWLNIKLIASDGVVNASTTFTINVGGWSYLQLILTVGAPIISAISAAWALYKERAIFLNRYYRKENLKDSFDIKAGERFKLTFTTPAHQIEQVSIKRPAGKACISCCQFFKLPRPLNNTALPDWARYSKGSNTLYTKTPIPSDLGESRLYIEAADEDGVVLEQYKLKIGNSEDDSTDYSGQEEGKASILLDPSSPLLRRSQATNPPQQSSDSQFQILR